MKKLRILLPGSPLEEALEARKRNAEHMSEVIAEMVEEATQLMERRYHTIIDLDHTDRRGHRRRTG